PRRSSDLLLIISNPLTGAFAITLLIAAVFIVQGILQIALAVRVRRQEGWHWFGISGLVAVAAGAMLTLKLPYTRIYTPGTIAGISLLVAGAAYVAIALTLRRARPCRDSPPVRHRTGAAGATVDTTRDPAIRLPTDSRVHSGGQQRWRTQQHRARSGPRPISTPSRR